jgi:hypothetical protein
VFVTLKPRITAVISDLKSLERTCKNIGIKKYIKRILSNPDFI